MKRILFLMLLGVFALSGCFGGKDVPTVWVVKEDGAKQCEVGSGRELKSDEDVLRGAGVMILKSQKGSTGQMNAQMCGMESGSQNEFLIPEGDLVKAQAQGFKKK